MTQIPGVGDRIRLVAMDDPDRISPGAIGTVASVERLLTEGTSWLQIEVDRDNGRALMLVSPPDRFEIVSGCTSRTTVAKARATRSLLGV
jgi:hypothetical protein